MFIDSQQNLSNAQAVTAIGDTPSSNVYDRGEPVAGAGMPTSLDIMLLVRVATTFTSAGAPTMQVVLQDSADNSSWADVLAGPTKALAAMTAKAELAKWKLPSNIRRYFRVVYRVATATYTGGQIDALIAKDVPNSQSFAWPNASYYVG